MFCQNCGSKISDGAAFCPDCGAQAAIVSAAAPVENVPAASVQPTYPQPTNTPAAYPQQAYAPASAPNSSIDPAKKWLKVLGIVGIVLGIIVCALFIFTLFLALTADQEFIESYTAAYGGAYSATEVMTGTVQGLIFGICLLLPGICSVLAAKDFSKAQLTSIVSIASVGLAIICLFVFGMGQLLEAIIVAALNVPIFFAAKTIKDNTTVPTQGMYVGV